jgi:hypothetical protein
MGDGRGEGDRPVRRSLVALGGRTLLAYAVIGLCFSVTQNLVGLVTGHLTAFVWTGSITDNAVLLFWWVVVPALTWPLDLWWAIYHKVLFRDGGALPGAATIAAIYRSGIRSPAWFKVKPKVTLDIVVTGSICFDDFGAHYSILSRPFAWSVKACNEATRDIHDALAVSKGSPFLTRILRIGRAACSK